jgi:Ca-activated chloride channel family protein
MLGSNRRPDGVPTRVMPVSAFVAALLLGGGILLGGVLALRDDAQAGGACADGADAIDLKVSAAPPLADALTSAADRYRATSPKVDGHCVTVTVTSRESRDTVAQLSTGWAPPAAAPALQHGRQRIPNPATAPPPDVWVPESTSWLALARTSESAAKLLPETGTTIAASPIVIAMPMPMARTIGWPNQPLTWAKLALNAGNPTFWSERGHAEWGPFRVGLAEPANSSASLASLMNIVSTENSTPVEKITPDTFAGRPARLSILAFERHVEEVSSSVDSLLVSLQQSDRRGNVFTRFSAFAVSERDVVAYNRGQRAGVAKGGKVPNVPLAAMYPPDGLTVEQVPFVVLQQAAADPYRSRAAENFLQALRGELGRDVLAAAGFRAPEGTNPALPEEAGLLAELPGKGQPTVDGAALAAAAKTFEGIHRRAATLVAFDTSGSMATEVPGSGGKTKMHVAVDAILTALGLAATDSRMGLWQFSAHLDGDRDYRELLPVRVLGKSEPGSHREHFETLARSLTPAGETGLYDTTLAAFRAMSDEYVPGMLNQVVLITDGVNDDPGSISLEELVATLVHDFDKDKPVRIITIAYGADADPEPLDRISRATGAKSYWSPDPTNIFDVLTDALLDR